MLIKVNGALSSVFTLPSQTRLQSVELRAAEKVTYLTDTQYCENCCSVCFINCSAQQISGYTEKGEHFNYTNTV